jgi:hypothetical protein
MSHKVMLVEELGALAGFGDQTFRLSDVMVKDL